MDNLEKHCVSLDLAKQLKEVGWNKETEFWWWKLTNYKGKKIFVITRNDYEETKEHRMHEDSPSYQYIKLYPAPLATEILEKLAFYIEEDYLLEIGKGSEGYVCQYRKYKKEKYKFVEGDEYLPNALAKCWLYLKKEKLL